MTKLPENLWKSPALIRRLHQEGCADSAYGVPAKPYFWVSVPEGDTKRGDITLRNFVPSIFEIEPHILQKEMAKELRRGLQREAHHDGMWIVGWTHPPVAGQAIRIDGDNVWHRLIMIWMDEDGDPQFVMESDRPVAEIISSGVGYYINMAQEAFEKWEVDYGKKALKEDFGIDPENLAKPVISSLH